jgi:stage II sporulation protein Q
MNKDGNKTPRKIDESSKSIVGAVPAAQRSGWRKLLAKRWVFPAAYMVAAAIIVTVLWLNAGGQGKQTEPDIPAQTESEAATEAAAQPEEATGSESSATPAAVNGEMLRWPVEEFEQFKTTMAFYDANASAEERQAAVIERDNTFTPHMAVDLARKDDKEFDVLAALSGKVTVAEQTPANGYEVHIQHDNGLETIYQSLKEVQVQVGQEVEQGDKIGVAGQSEWESQHGVHVHFELRSNGQSVNPANWIKSE